MSDINVTIPAYAAMQAQQALEERAGTLRRSLGRMRRHTFEADAVQAGLTATETALARIVEALYPVEAPEPDWAMAEDLSLGDHHVGVGR